MSDRVEFTKEMKKTHTLLLPNMAPIHFNLLRRVFQNFGYKAKLLDMDNSSTFVEAGLKYVHNDICYPAQLVIGQMISALESGKYDTDKVALVITQTGGGCRASNYLPLLRKALERAGFEKIPVVSLSLSHIENSGFKITLRMLIQAFAALIYGDVMMILSNQIRPYEIHKGESDELVNKWIKIIGDKFKKNRGFLFGEMKRNLNIMISSFAKIEKKDEKKIKVGIVGEIYMKYSAIGNNNLIQFLESQGSEVMVPSLFGFVFYCLTNVPQDEMYYGHKRFTALGSKLLMNIFYKTERTMIEAMSKPGCFTVPVPFLKMKEMVNGVIDCGVKMGEGWLLPGEMIDLAHMGYKNIVSVQPFGCLPNHVVSKGMIRKVSEITGANIVAIDYDPSQTNVNQENRLKLMLSIAKENLSD